MIFVSLNTPNTATLARTLLYRQCSTAEPTEVYYDTAAKGEVRLYPTLSVCTPYHIEPGTLLDSWCEGTTKVEVKSIWDGSGRPPRPAFEHVRTENAASCSASVCGLKIDDVSVVQAGDGTYTFTVHISGYAGAVEYSMNQFIDVQDSPVFEGMPHGDFTAYVRAKS